MSSQAWVAILWRLNYLLMNLGIFHTAPAALQIVLTSVPTAPDALHATLHTAPAARKTVP